MKSVGIKVLKNKLSEYVRLASAGETILITDRDEVVAELAAPRVERSPILADAMLADAVRNGWLKPPTLSGQHDMPESKPILQLSEILEELEHDRLDR